MKKIIVVTSILVVLVMATSMFVYASPNIYEFLAALLLKALILVKLKLPMLLVGLFLSLKKFILGLTFVKVVLLGIKRFLIDHVITKNLQEHFFVHLKKPLKHWWNNFDVRKKLFFFVPASVISLIALYIAGLGKLLSFLGIKTLVISFFKGLWVVAAKVFYFFTSYIWTSWFAPILEVLVFSWLLTLAEKVPVLKTMTQKLYAFISTLFSRTGTLLYQFVNQPVQRKLNQLGRHIAIYVHRKNRKARAEKNALASLQNPDTPNRTSDPTQDKTDPP